MLIIFAGLPGVGKTAIARELAHKLGAVYLRIDTIEQEMRIAGSVTGSMDESGYRVAYAIAADNLRLGRTIVADCVNPLGITREAWRDVARKAKVGSLEIEVKCSDCDEHRRRVENRAADIEGLTLPTWAEVIAREYEPWDRKHVEIDTNHLSVGQSVAIIRSRLRETD